jgi:hypothetical protein
MGVFMENDIKYIVNEAGEKEYVIIPVSVYEQLVALRIDQPETVFEKEDPQMEARPQTEETDETEETELTDESDESDVSDESELDGSDDHEGETLFYFEAGQVKARGFPRGSIANPEFLILKGSSALWFDVDSMPEYARLYRDSLIENNILKKEEAYYIFLQDYAFNSPNEAASAIAGKSRNGMMDWKTSDGKTLYDHGYGKQG